MTSSQVTTNCYSKCATCASRQGFLLPFSYVLHQCRCVCSHISPGILHPSPVATRQRDETKGKGFSTSPLRWTICLGLPPLVAWYGVRRRSLDHSGGMAAIVVGFVLTLASGCFCVSLLVFFFTSSRLTRWRGREKEKFEEDHKKGVELRSVYHCMQMCTVLADLALKSSLAWIDSCCHS